MKALKNIINSVLIILTSPKEMIAAKNNRNIIFSRNTANVGDRTPSGLMPALIPVRVVTKVTPGQHH